MTQDSQATGAICERIVFSGRVQGVGFRATTATFARRRGVLGFVRNQTDGTVELIARGMSEAIDNLVADLKHQFGPKIVNFDRQLVEPGEYFRGFEIRH
jgi:acylphosphatase